MENEIHADYAAEKYAESGFILNAGWTASPDLEYKAGYWVSKTVSHEKKHGRSV